jgi:hypothetical protein
MTNYGVKHKREKAELDNTVQLRSEQWSSGGVIKRFTSNESEDILKLNQLIFE